MGQPAREPVFCRLPAPTDEEVVILVEKIARRTFRWLTGGPWEGYLHTGRSWTNIKLDVSETDFDKLSASFSQNIIGKQTTVFDSKWTWEGQSGAPLLRPAAWGGPGGKLSFPFQTAWVYSGRKAMLMDYRFRGGALANGVPWGFNGHYFFLDGTPTSGFAVASGELLPSSLKGCTDSYWANTRPSVRCGTS